MNELLDFQHLFDTDLEQLMYAEEDDLEFIEQSHSGDLLIEEVEDGNERFRLWRNLDCNIQYGEPLIEIEHCGKINNYTWKTIFKYFDYM